MEGARAVYGIHCAGAWIFTIKQNFIFFFSLYNTYLIDFFFQKVFTISLIPHSQEALSPAVLNLNPTTIPCIYPRFIFHTSAQLLTTETSFWDSLQLATSLLP